MQTPMRGASPLLNRMLADIVLHPAAQVAAALWIAAYGAVLLLAGGHLPFDRPALAQVPFAVQVAAPTLEMVEIFLLMGVVHWLTRKRLIPDIAARAPARGVAYAVSEPTAETRPRERAPYSVTTWWVRIDSSAASTILRLLTPSSICSARSRSSSMARSR